MARRVRGQPAGLTRDLIATAAVRLVDREGLEAFGVRRLAAELGVDPMSIYHHLKGKAGLLDAISEWVLDEVAAAATPWPDDWLDLARQLARAYRSGACRHPHVVPLLATRAQRSATALGAVERLTAAMRRAGLPAQTVADAPLVLFGFLNGYLLATVSSAVVDPDRGGPAAPPELDPHLYPTLHELSLLQTGFGSDEEFERMLETVLVGIARAVP